MRRVVWSTYKPQQNLRPLSSRETLHRFSLHSAGNFSLSRWGYQMVSFAAVGSIPSPLSVGKASSWSHRQITSSSFHHEPSRHSNSSSSFPPISDDGARSDYKPVIGRRQILKSSIGLLTAAALGKISVDRQVALASEFADMPALKGKDYGKTKMRYPDYTETSSGLQYKDLRDGRGPTPKMGETVVVDWDGYTIGYYGRIFEARNKTKGGSFEGDDKSFYRFRLGSQEVIPAFEEAVSGMALGGIRRWKFTPKVCRIIVPPELGYPENDYNKSGPRPTTFSGQRALDFVLRNQGLIDKTLLFDIELVNIISN